MALFYSKLGHASWVYKFVAHLNNKQGSCKHFKVKKTDKWEKRKKKTKIILT